MPADTDHLHDCAMKAEDALEQLATGIAGLGAPDETVKGITEMANACRQIGSQLAKSMRDEPAPTERPTTDEAISSHMAGRRAAAAPQPPA